MKINKKYLAFCVVVIAIILITALLEKHTANSDNAKIANFSVNPAKEATYPRAVELTGATGFINANKDLSISSLVGKKVILVDFWTYSCINCLRTVPHLNAWYDKYKDDGLVIIGVHTPEFSFEKDYNNVAAAVKQLGIKYPVVLDSNQSIWNAYQNQYWPAEYLIDIDGYVVQTHFGEGNYNETELEIQKLLLERGVKLGKQLQMNSNATAVNDSTDFSGIQSPETYFGAERNVYLGNGQRGVLGYQNLTVPHDLSFNTLYLLGGWNFTAEYATPASSNSAIVYGYSAKNVYMVTDAPKDSKIVAIIDGKDAHTVALGPYNLYTVQNGSNYGAHSLLLANLTSDMKFYTFTFG